MKKTLILLLAPIQLFAQNLTPINWDSLAKFQPWRVTELERNVPIVTPATEKAAPSDAVVLFDGTDLSEWQKTPFGEGVLMSRNEQFLRNFKAEENPKPADWTIDNGEMVVGKNLGAIGTKKVFGDMQLHIEWRTPILEEDVTGQNYGNSGIFLMGLYEIQVLNSFENETYANGQAGSIYKQHTPMVNASLPPGEWQTYDIMFTAPRFSEKGQLISPARVTVLHNGILIQHNSVLQGPTVYIGEPYYVPHPEKLPIVLQDHDNPVRYRNIWVREL